MRVVLARTGDLLLLSYPAMILLGILAALGTLAWRVRNRPLDRAALAGSLTSAVLVGWLGTRLVVVLLRGGLSGLSLGIFFPTRHSTTSFTIFALVASPIVLLDLWRRRLPILAYLDAMAPSVLVLLALAKVGCLLAGCCAGSECPAGWWGMRYPYGSAPYIAQVANGTLRPPDALLRDDDDAHERLFGHVDFLRGVRHDPPEELTAHAARHGMTYPEWVQLAEGERSRPVWPVPLWYSLTAALIWIAAEVVYRRSVQPGWAMSVVLIGYAGMRLGFDPFVAKAGRTILGVPVTQAVAIVSLAVGIALAARCWVKRPH